MTRMFAAALAALLGGCASLTPDPEAAFRLNEIQVLGTHNSYARPVDPRVLAVVDPLVGRLGAAMLERMSVQQRAIFQEEHPANVTLGEGLAYDHPPLADQLNAGLRSLEIDVYNDTKGGLFSDPASYRALKAKGVADLAPHDTTGLDAPGFKVLHVADIDFRSHCPTFAMCLSQLRDWSNAHPRHAPIFILLEAKTQTIPLFPGSITPERFDTAAFDALDAEIVRVLGRERLIIPDDVRGNAETLEIAVRAKRWPTLAAARGKFIFLMTAAIDQGSITPYLDGHPSLAGRVAFLRGQPGEPHAAFLLLDNAIVRGSEIQQRVKEGYIVRTRSDIETHEARVNDMTRANAAFASGAQVISTDFFRPGNPFGTPYFVALPGGGEARCNPVAAPRSCSLTKR